MLGHPSLSPRGCEAPAALAGLWLPSADNYVRVRHTELVLMFHIGALTLWLCVGAGQWRRGVEHPYGVHV